MATSNIYLYEVGFKASQNAKLDNIESYLTSIGTNAYFIGFQYVKHDLDITIKIPYPQYRNTHNNINYVKIVNSDDLNFPYYYYVTKPIWRSQDTIELHLSMDTLNTFRDFLTLGNNTVIYRQHEDRFMEPEGGAPTTAFNAIRSISMTDEGLGGLVKYKKALKETIGSTFKKWYLVYCTDQSGGSAVTCYLLPETASSYNQPIGSTTFNNFITTDYYGSLIMSTNGFTVNGITYHSTSQRKYILYRTANVAGISYYEVFNGGYTDVMANLDMDTQITFLGDTDVTNSFLYSGNGSFIDVNSETRKILYQAIIQNQYSTSSTTASPITLDSIADVDRTLSYLVKIIECPYPPIDIQSAIDNNKVCIIDTYDLSSQALRVLKLIDLETDFNIKIAPDYALTEFRTTIPSLASRLTALKNINYESKMYHSATFSKVFTYDSFALDLPYEEFSSFDPDRPSLDIYYKQSNAINSGLYFKFDVHSGYWMQTEALQDILICNRNNEYPIYNSSYLDYIRTGYNFDKKSKWQQLGQNLTNTGLNTLGAGLSWLAKGATNSLSLVGGISLATNAISSLSSTIFNHVATNNEIARKKAEAKATAASVSGSDDLNLLNGYMGNKLIAFTYEAPVSVRSKVFDLYYLTGYACEKTGVPNTTSRYRFNYLQCEPDLILEHDARLVKYIEDIKERFRLGVTYFHRYDDFRQTKENWEEWLITE